MTLTAQIVAAVAKHENKTPEDLPPLYDAIDIDALETIVDDVTTVSFRYHRSRVTIAEGELIVESADRT